MSSTDHYPLSTDRSANCGHVDDPEFQAREARWAVERVAARARFWRTAEYLGRLSGATRAAELDRFEALHGAIARREMEGFLNYRETRKREV